MDDRGHPIERFDSLLRDLVRWGLVARHQTKTRASWQLVPAAQRRLDELLSAHVAKADVYLDRICADCHRRELTRRRGEAYVCDDCWSQRQARMSVVAELPDDARPTPFWRRLRSTDDQRAKAHNETKDDSEPTEAAP